MGGTPVATIRSDDVFPGDPAVQAGRLILFRGGRSHGGWHRRGGRDERAAGVGKPKIGCECPGMGQSGRCEPDLSQSRINKAASRSPRARPTVSPLFTRLQVLSAFNSVHIDANLITARPLGVGVGVGVLKHSASLGSGKHQRRRQKIGSRIKAGVRQLKRKDREGLIRLSQQCMPGIAEHGADRRFSC